MADISKINVNGTVYDIKDDVSTRAAGIIYPFGGSVIPHGFLACDGASYLRASYPELFAVIGTTYGAADSTHFNVPNLQGKFPLGKSNSHTIGSSGGTETVKLSATIGACNNDAKTIGYIADSTIPYQGTQSPTYVVQGSQNISPANWNHSTPVVEQNKTSRDVNNMPPFQTIAYIISTGESGLSVQDVITDITTLPLGVQYGGTGANNAVQALSNLGATKIDLLWTNANPTTNFSPQFVRIDSIQNYELAFVVFKLATGQDNFATCVSNKMEDGKYIFHNMLVNNKISFRPFCFRAVPEAGIYFVDGRKIVDYGVGYTSDNSIVLPYKIYGIKI